MPCFLRGDDPDQVQRVSHFCDLSPGCVNIPGTPTSCGDCKHSDCQVIQPLRIARHFAAPIMAKVELRQRCKK